MRLSGALLALAMFGSAAWAEPLEITAVPLASFQTFGSSGSFGPLSWRGGLSLESDASAFGGFSGLALQDNCEQMLAISDAGRWFRTRLRYEGGRLAGLAGGELAPMRDSKGKPQRGKVWADAEAMTIIAPGKFAVAYENRVRLGVYDIGTQGLDARFEPMPYPREIDMGPDNGEVEALGLLRAGSHKGSYIAISERHTDARNNLRAWLWRGRKILPFSIERFEDYDVTDLTVLSDGTVLTLERSFSRTSLPGMAIRRFVPDLLKPGTTVTPELLFSGRVPFYAIDNMEGIASCEHEGEARITVMSDNNFNATLQRTLLLQFAYEP